MSVQNHSEPSNSWNIWIKVVDKQWIIIMFIIKLKISKSINKGLTFMCQSFNQHVSFLYCQWHMASWGTRYVRVVCLTELRAQHPSRLMVQKKKRGWNYSRAMTMVMGYKTMSFNVPSHPPPLPGSLLYSPLSQFITSSEKAMRQIQSISHSL